jgi:hypothetical protein
LNIYGFQRIVKGVDKNCYYHPYFLRGHPHLIPKIDRIPLKKDHPSQTISSPTPDFYSMPSLTKGAHEEQMEHDAAYTMAMNRDHRTNLLRLMNIDTRNPLENHITATNPAFVDLSNQYYSPRMTGNAALLQSILRGRPNITSTMPVRSSNFTDESSWTLLERLNYLKSLSGALPPYGEATYASRDNVSMLPTSSVLNLMPRNTRSSELNAVVRAQQLLSMQLQRGINAASTLEHLHHSEGESNQDKLRTSMKSIM